jgi:MFS family permease
MATNDRHNIQRKTNRRNAPLPSIEESTHEIMRADPLSRREAARRATTLEDDLKIQRKAYANIFLLGIAVFAIVLAVFHSYHWFWLSITVFAIYFTNETHGKPRKKTRHQTDDERRDRDAKYLFQIEQKTWYANFFMVFITICAMFFFPWGIYHYKKGSNDRTQQDEIRFLPVQELPNGKHPWDNCETICIAIMIFLANFATIQRINPRYYRERIFMMISMIVLYYVVFFFLLNHHLIDDLLMQISFFAILVVRCYLNSRDVTLVDVASID